jgi:hypothetical protein
MREHCPAAPVWQVSFQDERKHNAMSFGKIGFTHLKQQLEAALSLTLPVSAPRESSGDSPNGPDDFLNGDVSSLSIALFQMGLSKQMSDGSDTNAVSPIL